MDHEITIRSTNTPRYETVGDWQIDLTGDLRVLVTGLDVTSDEGFLIALHELVEMMLCRKRGITQQQVDEFDLAFAGDGEPGDDPACPYRSEHRAAMLIEHLMARELGMIGYGRVE